MKKLLFGLTCALAVLAALTVWNANAEEKKPQKKKPKEEASIWMQKKLEHSQKILAGLTSGDFEKIVASAEAMKTLSYLEEWDRANLPEYRRQLANFSDANKELIRQANRKNINGATLAYTQLMLSCVQCHNLVREKR